MKKLLSQLLSVLVLCLFLCGCVDCSVSPEPHKTVISTETAYTGLKVHFVDVGQGDCILLESDGSFALIDAGEYSEASRVISYLSSQGAETLDYIFATHPHSDHCGSLAEVIRSFECKVLVSPDAGADSAAWEY
ncbi:MAG: MBL fold metallo-hydrolase, partial [Ruminococcus sp.]